MKKVMCAGLVAILALAVRAEVVPGVMNSSFSESLEYCENNHIPLVLVFGDEDCKYCEHLDENLSTPAAKKKMKELGYVFCHVLGERNAEKFAKAHGTSKLNGWPYVCAYWKRGDGDVVEDHFTGRGPDDSWAHVDYMTADQFFEKVAEIFKSASFLVGNTPLDRLEAVPGKTTRVFVPLKDLKEADRDSYAIVAKFPQGGGQVTTTNQWVTIPTGVAFRPNDEVKLELLRDGKVVDTNAITFVAEPDCSVAYPKWVGETFDYGEWTMDYKTAADRGGKVLAMFTGTLWCPYCYGCETSLLSDDRFTQWARSNEVSLVTFDQGNGSEPATAAGNGKARLLTYEVGESHIVKGEEPSGAFYLSSKGIDADAAQSRIALTTRYTQEWQAPGSTKARFGNPTFLLVKGGKVVGRFATYRNGADYEADENLARLGDLLKLFDRDDDSSDYAATTRLTHEVGGSNDFDVQVNSASRAFVVTGLSKSGQLTFKAENAKGRSVVLDYYVDGRATATATNSLTVKVKKSDLVKRLVVRVNGYPNTADRIGGSSVCGISLTSSFEPSAIVESATLPLRFSADVCLEELDLEGVRSVRVSKTGSLPSGLSIKYDKESGSIVLKGKPTRAKTVTVTYTYTLTYKDGHRETSEPVEVTVEAYNPAEQNPHLGEKMSRTVPLVEEGRLVGLLTVSATTSARITAKFTGDEKVSFSGYWGTLDEDATAHAVLTKKDATLDLSLGADGTLTAHLSNAGGFAALEGDSMPLADAAAFAGKYSVTLANTNEAGVNFGHGSLQLTMTSSSRIKTGTMSYSGVLPDGSTFSGTSQLCADGRLVYEDGSAYACAVLPICKKTSKYEVAFLLRVRAEGGETYWDESAGLAHVVFASELGDSLWNGMPLQPYGSWFKDGVALSGWQDVYEEYMSTNFVLKLDGEKVATVTATGTRVKLTDKPEGSSVSMSYTKSSGKLSGSIRLKLGDGSKLSGSWKGVILPGWHHDCCGGDELPFGMGTFYYTDRSSGKSVRASLPVTLEITGKE